MLDAQDVVQYAVHDRVVDDAVADRAALLVRGPSPWSRRARKDCEAAFSVICAAAASWVTVWSGGVHLHQQA